MEEHIARVDHVGRLLERHPTDVREVVHARRGVRVVEQRLHRVGLGAPRADGVVVDRRTRRQRDPYRSLEERREPLDQMANDVTGDPAVHRRRLVPRLRSGALDGRGERSDDPPVLVGGLAHRSSATRASSLA